jgi:crossover junction endodeoxyribonuclease RuvC
MFSRSIPTPTSPKSSWRSRPEDKRTEIELVTSTVRILGIDPGSQVTGYGLLDSSGGRMSLVRWGAIKTSGNHSERLRCIFEEVVRIVADFTPAEVAIERVFMHRNADSALKLGQARAAALCATFGARLPIFEYSARHIKKAVVGRGSAAKDQVEQMVRMLLGVKQPIQPDAADALAAALCHAHERGTRSLLASAVGAP